jgi:hypothetical protein
MLLRKQTKHTRVIAVDSRFHKCLHPLADHDLFIRAEEISAIRLVQQLEPVSPRVNVLICDNTIADNVDISFDLCFL